MRTFLLLILAAVGLTYVQRAPAQTIDGLSLELVYTGDVAANISGGIDQGVRYVDNLDLILSVDGDRFGWRGGGVMLYGIANQGGSISSLVGDAQGVNNIEAPTNWRLHEAWIEQAIGTRVSVLAGVYDLNSEFDVNRTGALFINGSHGTGLDLSQSGLNGPSIFPVTGLGARVRFTPADGVEARAAILDGVPGDPDSPTGTHVLLRDEDGLLLAAELELFKRSDGHRRRLRKGPRRILEEIDTQVRLVLGAWAYSSDFDRIAAPTQTGRSRGGYLLGEWAAYRETDPEQGIRTFVRYGIAEETVNRFATYLGTGLVYTGLLAGRDSDQAGLAVAVAVNGDPYLQANRPLLQPGQLARTETNVEVTYLAEMAPWLSVQADLQYVVHPDTREDVSNAVVPTLRIIFAP